MIDFKHLRNKTQYFPCELIIYRKQKTDALQEVGIENCAICLNICMKLFGEVTSLEVIL